jgi:hypothetical protein
MITKDGQDIREDSFDVVEYVLPEMLPGQTSAIPSPLDWRFTSLGNGCYRRRPAPHDE